MKRDRARGHVEEAQAHAVSYGRGLLRGTFAVRHRKGLDVAFLLDDAVGDLQIGMGAAADDYSSVLSIGIDLQGGRVHATGSWTDSGRSHRLPVRIAYRTPTVILMEANGLPLARRPQSLKCWSFLRCGGDDHYSDVTGYVTRDLADLPPVALRTYPAGPRG